MDRLVLGSGDRRLTLAPTATPNQHRRLLAALVAERQRHITPGSDRELLARQIERAVAKAAERFLAKAKGKLET